MFNLINKLSNHLKGIHPPKKHNRWLYLIAFPAGHGAVDWGGGALWILGPAMALSMDLTPLQLGLIFAVRQLATGITQLPAGIIGDNLERQGNILLVTFWWVSIAQIIASVSSDYWMVILFLTIASSGAAAWHPIAMGSMVKWMPERKGFVLATHMVGGTIAEITAPLVAGILLIFLNWDQVLQINTLPTVILGLLFIKLAPMVKTPSYESQIDQKFKDLARSVMQPGSIAILMMIMLHNMSLVAFMSMAPLYFQEIRGLSSGLTGLGFSLFLIGGALTAPFIGYVSDKIGRKTMSIWGLVGGGIFAWLITISSNNFTIFSLLIITGLLMLSVRSVIIAMALEKIGHRESTVLGLISCVGEGCAALGAVFGGILGAISLSYSIIFAGILSIIAGITIWPLNQRSH